MPPNDQNGSHICSPPEPSLLPAAAVAGRISDRYDAAMVLTAPPAWSAPVTPPPPVPPMVVTDETGMVCAVPAAPVCAPPAVPALPAIGQAFAAPQSQVQLTLSLFLLIYAVAQVVLGPLSDRVGRRPVLLVATALFAGASAWAALAESIESLIAARAVQALGGCAAMVVPRAVVRDTHAGPCALRAMSLVTMALAVTPALAPLFGGWLVTLFGWRQVFVLCGLYGCALFAWMWLRFGESLAAERRTRDTPASLLCAGL